MDPLTIGVVCLLTSTALALGFLSVLGIALAMLVQREDALEEPAPACSCAG